MKIGKKILSLFLCIAFLCSGLAVNSFAADEFTYGDYSYTVSSNKVTIVSYPEQATGAVNIPSKIDGKEVVAIDDGAFQACTLITEVIIPDTVKTIGKYAFAYCVTLKSVTIPSSVTSIGKNAFQNSKSVTIKCESGSYAEKYATENGITTNKPAETKIVIEEESVDAYTGREIIISASFFSKTLAPSSSTVSYKIEGSVPDGLTVNGGLSCIGTKENGFLSISLKAIKEGIYTVSFYSSDGAYDSIIINVKKSFSYSDTWNFANIGSSFSDSFDGEGYYIPSSRYEEVFGKSYVDNVEIPTEWDGNCFGMSASSVLFYLKKLNWESFNSLYENDFSTVNKYCKQIFWESPSGTLSRYYYTSSGYNTPVTQLIERYQILQNSSKNYAYGDNTTADLLENNYFKFVEQSEDVNGKVYLVYSHVEKGNYIKNILQKLINSTVPLGIGMRYNTGGHAIVARTDKKPEKQSNGWWKVYVYDPNDPYMPESLTLNELKGKKIKDYYINNKEERYIELNPEKNQFRYKGGINSKGEIEYRGSDAKGNVLYKEEDSSNCYIGMPEYMVLRDFSNLPTVFNGSEPWMSSTGESTIDLNENQSFKVLDNEGNLLAIVSDGSTCSFSKEAIFYTYEESSTFGSKLNGKLKLLTDTYSVISDYGKIDIIGSNSVCTIDSQQKVRCDVDLSKNSLSLLSDNNAEVSAKVANIKDESTYSTAFIDGNFKNGECVNISVTGDTLNVSSSKKNSTVTVSCKNEKSEKKELGKVTEIKKANIRAKAVAIGLSDLTINYKCSAKINPKIDVEAGTEYSVSYTSSNPKVATVDENGKVYGAKKGSATITCTVTDSNGNTVQDTCKVTVKYSFGQWLIKILLFGWIWY